MNPICQLYVPAFYRSYGRNAIIMIDNLLEKITKVGFKGIYLIGLFQDGGYDNGFDVVSYSVDPRFGTEEEFRRLIDWAHVFKLSVGVDIVPHHVSDKNILAERCLNGVSGYEDCLYVVDKAEAERLTAAGVPSFFGKLAYSDFGDKYVRSTFADYHQLDLNWESKKVQDYFADIFRKFKKWEIDFVRVDCGMMLLEDVSKADKGNPLACMNPEQSINAIRNVSDDMKLFFEWFIPGTAYLFDDMSDCYALDCSYVMTGKLNMDWSHKKLIPVVGGHDQMTLADRGIKLSEALDKMKNSEYGFLDLQSYVGWKTKPKIMPGDERYDADLKNPNQRYRARRPIDPVVCKFISRAY